MSYAMTYGRSKLFRAPMQRYGAMERVAPQLVSNLKSQGAVLLGSGLAVGLMDYGRGRYGDKAVTVETGGISVSWETLVGGSLLAVAVLGPASAKWPKWLPQGLIEGAAAGLLTSSIGRAARKMGEEARAQAGG